MAAMNKSLAQRNKSRTGAEATNKREISQSSLVRNGGCAVSGCQSAGKRCSKPLISRNWTTSNMSMAATNKSLARNNKSRTWVEPTKKRRTPSRHGDSRRLGVTVPDSDRRQNEECAQTKRNRLCSPLLPPKRTGELEERSKLKKPR
jgi:hypothetical protein